MDKADLLVGTYGLVAVEHHADDGEVGYPFGMHPRGFIFYSPEGYMSATLMRGDRPLFAAGDILAATDDERVAAFSSSSAYAGRYEVLEERIVHHLEVTTFPNWTGTDQVREFDVSSSHLTLYPPRMLMDGKMRRGRVHFERLVGPATGA
jgi:Lipocalin-like domain